MSSIYENHVKLNNRYFFNSTSFYGHQLFRTVSDNCFRVTFICGSENHKSHDNFSFKFSISIKLSLWFWGVGFFKFSKNCNKWTAWWGLYFVILYVLEVETFLGEFSGYHRTNNYPVDTGRSYIRHRTTYI